MIRRLLNLALVVALAPLIVSFAYEGFLFLVSVFTFDATKWFLLGSALSLLIYVVLLRDSIRFIEVLLHELEHAAASFIFTFRLPQRLEIDTEGRSRVFVPTTGGCIVTLAPYFLPLLMIPFLLLKALAGLAFFLLKAPFPTFLAAVFDLLIGITLTFHFLCSIKEFGSFQTDIKETGMIASIIGVLFLNLMFLVVSMAVVTGSYPELLDYAKTALAATVNAYKAAFDFLITHLLPALGDLIETIKHLICPECTPTP